MIWKCPNVFVFLYMKIKDITKSYFEQDSGIYKIINNINNKVYIGSSDQLYKRFQSHKSGLINNKHDNPHLQNSFNKYGINNFSFEIIEYCNNLFERESYYFSLYQENCYNIRIIIESNKGIKRIYNKEQALKVSKALKGKIPKNLNTIQQNRRKKVAKYIDEKIVQIFDSCVEAAKSLNMTPKAFNMYIGKKYRLKDGKYMKKNEKYEYYKGD